METPSIDAYHLWLGIPPSEQPPDAYRILGVSQFETEPKVIENAVNLRLRHLATHQSGPHGARATELIQEVRQTGVTLLNPESRTRYDARLSQHLATQLASVPIAHSSTAVQSLPAKANSSVGGRGMIVLIACGAATLLAGVLCTAIGYWVLRGGDEQRASRETAAEAYDPPAIDDEQANHQLESTSPDALGSKTSPSNDEASEDGQPLAPPATNNEDTDQSARIGQVGSNVQTKTFTPPAKPIGGGLGGSHNIASTPTDSVKPAAPDKPVSVPTTPTTPTPTTPTTKPSVSSDADPFTTWPVAIELPSLLDKKARSLAQLTSNAKIELELNSEFAKLEEGERIVASPIDGDESRWRILLSDEKTGDKKTGDEDKAGVELAQLAHRENEFQFVWSEGAPVAKTLQVKNCVLNIASQKHSRTIPLRKPLRESTFTISLEKRVDTRVLDVANLPKTDDLRLEVELLNQFPMTAYWKNDQRKAAKGKYLAVQLKDYPGTEIRFKVDRKGREEIAVYVMPVYNPNARISFDLSIDRLQNMEKGAQRAVLGARRDLTRAEARLRALKSKQSSINAQRTNNVFQQQAKAAAQFGVTRDLNSTSKKIATSKRRIVESETLLKKLPEAQELITKLHNKAQVKLRVFVEGEEAQLPLYIASDS